MHVDCLSFAVVIGIAQSPTTTAIVIGGGIGLSFNCHPGDIACSVMCLSTAHVQKISTVCVVTLIGFSISNTD